MPNSSNRRHGMTWSDFLCENPHDPAQYLRIVTGTVTIMKWNTFVITGTWHMDGNTIFTGKVDHPQTMNGFMKTT